MVNWVQLNVSICLVGLIVCGFGTANADVQTEQRLRADVEFLAGLQPPRNFANVPSLNRAAEFIAASFRQSGCQTSRQSFQADGETYHNIICRFGTGDAPRLVIGAHYDVFGNLPGADDNASGVAGILELARRLGQNRPNLPHQVELVAYSLEEPPHFRQKTMGSFVHAKSLADSGVTVKMMISVEMIGYFTDAPDSQGYPTRLLNLFYPDIGNFIGVVGLAFTSHDVGRIEELMAHDNALPVESIKAPKFLTGIDFSDHLNYWLFDYPAVMVTDTSFLRNRNYHRHTDTPDTLDYGRMAKVVDGLYTVATKF